MVWEFSHYGSESSVAWKTASGEYVIIKGPPTAPEIYKNRMLSILLDRKMVEVYFWANIGQKIHYGTLTRNQDGVLH